MSTDRGAFTSKIQLQIEELLRDLAELVEPEDVIEYLEYLAEQRRRMLEP